MSAGHSSWVIFQLSNKKETYLHFLLRPFHPHCWSCSFFFGPKRYDGCAIWWWCCSRPLFYVPVSLAVSSSFWCAHYMALFDFANNFLWKREGNHTPSRLLFPHLNTESLNVCIRQDKETTILFDRKTFESILYTHIILKGGVDVPSYSSTTRNCIVSKQYNSLSLFLCNLTYQDWIDIP